MSSPKSAPGSRTRSRERAGYEGIWHARAHVNILLDTNIVIALIKRDAAVLERLRACAPRDVAISAVVLHELYYGAFKSAHVSRNLAVVEGLRFAVLDLDPDDARHAGEIRALLAKAGTPIGPYDVLIAGQARARRLTLVTRNTAEFARVPDLAIEDWHA